jgi:hypothetical protein
MRYGVAACFGPDGRLYVSCQDTNTVVAILPKTRKPAPVAEHLSKSFPSGNFLPGTLVASSQGRLPEVGDRAPLDVPSPQGLEVVLDVHGKPQHSVRGIIVHRQHLYVADEAGNAVKVFEVKSGMLVARIKGKQLAKPVHLILHGDTLYIGADEQIGGDPLESCSRPAVNRRILRHPISSLPGLFQFGYARL